MLSEAQLVAAGKVVLPVVVIDNSAPALTIAGNGKAKPRTMKVPGVFDRARLRDGFAALIPLGPDACELTAAFGKWVIALPAGQMMAVLLGEEPAGERDDDGPADQPDETGG